MQMSLKDNFKFVYMFNFYQCNINEFITALINIDKKTEFINITPVELMPLHFMEKNIVQHRQIYPF